MKVTAYSFVFLTACLSLTSAEELGALARNFSWPGGNNNFSTYTKGTGGPVTDAASGTGWQCHAVANYHSLSGSYAASGGNGSSSIGDLGGLAYWFDQITISSPTVPNGTVGVADFTLFFEGAVASTPHDSRLRFATNVSSISYRWAAVVVGEGGDGQPDLNVGDKFEERIEVNSSNTQTFGANFRNQPRQHQVTFRYGVPFDFTVSVEAAGKLAQNVPSKILGEVRCTGWNGFQNFSVRDANPVSDASVTSSTGFNYGSPGTTTYTKWASLYQLDASSKQMDSNQNGLTDLMEYALGRNPIAHGSGDPFTPALMQIGGQRFSCFSFVRPTLGAAPSGIIYTPQRSLSLDGWGSEGVVIESAPADPLHETVTVRSMHPVTEEPKEFLRLEVAEP